MHGPKYRALTNAEKSDLVRLHRNLGHPDPVRLANHLQAAGASECVVAACKDFVCDACVDSTTVRHQRPAKLKEEGEFNQTLGVDGFFWTGRAGFECYVIHALDESSAFHLGRRAFDRSSSAAIGVLRDMWYSWAGPPENVYIDPAGEFRADEILDFFQESNTRHFSATEAWQRGRIERHGDVVKQMLTRVDLDKPIVDITEFDRILNEC